MEIVSFNYACVQLDTWIAATLMPTFVLAEIDFNRDIRPVLSDKCFCLPMAPMSMTVRLTCGWILVRGALADLDGYAAIVPGHPEKSAFIERILHDDPDEIMPPPKSHKTLDAAEIDLLTRWIKEGAEYADAWTYVAPKATAVPKPKGRKWVRNEIDAYVLDRLNREGLKPSPENRSTHTCTPAEF